MHSQTGMRGGGHRHGVKSGPAWFHDVSGIPARVSAWRDAVLQRATVPHRYTFARACSHPCNLTVILQTRLRRGSGTTRLPGNERTHPAPRARRRRPTRAGSPASRAGGARPAPRRRTQSKNEGTSIAPPAASNSSTTAAASASSSCTSSVVAASPKAPSTIAA